MTASELFEKGLKYLRDGETVRALSYFDRSFKLNNTAECQSYLGLCIAIERTDHKKGIYLCEEAISKEPKNPVLYLNLGKLYLRIGRKKEAIDEIRKSLDVGYTDEANKLLKNIGVRRKPLFPSLKRQHFLNKYSGKILSRLGIKGPQDYGFKL